MALRNIQLFKVTAHAGDDSNGMADKLAKDGAEFEDIDGRDFSKDLSAVQALKRASDTEKQPKQKQKKVKKQTKKSKKQQQ